MFLAIAASLEITGDAMIRRGLVQSTWISVLLGGALLAGYGFAVNVDRTIDFGRLMGLYIAIFFVVSQAISFVVFGERPSVAVLAGGALIVAGGLVMLLLPSA
ncbi:MAG: hypothetical protein HYR72_00690 [Deltaproteobacteria bacterium]|nr:hypothetical protein [Deltaproteobacteria bacterium]MBI3389453.1 hypothetical protein [Deltaproteobacteria bacterium]